MSVGVIALSIVIGAVLGLIGGYGNMCITRAAVKKQNGDGLAAVTSTNLIRMVVNVAVLALIFLTRNVVPLNFYVTLISCALVLSAANPLFVMRLARQMKADMEAQQQPDQGGDDLA